MRSTNLTAALLRRSIATNPSGTLATYLLPFFKNVPNSEIRTEIIKTLQVISKTDEVQNVQFMCDESLTWVKDALYMEALQVGSDGLMKKDDALKLKAQQITDERAKISIDTDLGLDFDDIDEMLYDFRDAVLHEFNHMYEYYYRAIKGEKGLDTTLSFMKKPFEMFDTGVIIACSCIQIRIDIGWIYINCFLI